MTAAGESPWARALHRPEWFDEAACRGLDPNLFFPERNEMADVAKALKVCYRCPHQTACLEWAINNGETYGVWGGTSASERGKIATLWRKTGRQTDRWYYRRQNPEEDR